MNTSLVICTRNRGALIAQTLESICRGACLPGEIVIVDQSDDTTTRDAVLPFRQVCPRLRYIATATRGLSRARNVGLQETSGEVIVWTDDDVIVDERWMETIIAEFEAFSDLMLLYGTVVPPDTYDWHTEFIPHVYLPTTRPLTLFHPSAMSGIGANMAMRRQLIESVGPFDPLLGAGVPIGCAEDFDLTLRTLIDEPQMRVHLVDEARVVHHAGARRGGEYKRFVHATGGGIGAFWGYSLRSRLLRPRACLLCLLKFLQEQGRYGRYFLDRILQGKWPSGGITYSYLLTAFWREFLLPSREPGTCVCQPPRTVLAPLRKQETGNEAE